MNYATYHDTVKGKALPKANILQAVLSEVNTEHDMSMGLKTRA